MTDKEKIRAEIERRLEIREFGYEDGSAEHGYRDALKDIKDFIDSMQDEPESEEVMTIRKDWFEHCKKSWYNEGYIDGKHKAVKWIEEINNHHHIVRYSDSCEPTLNELIEWFDNFMEGKQ